MEVRDASTASINVSNSVFDSGCRGPARPPLVLRVFWGVLRGFGGFGFLGFRFCGCCKPGFWSTGAARLHVLSVKGEVTVTGSWFETRFYAGCQTFRQNSDAFYLTDASGTSGSNVTVADTTFIGMERGISLLERYGDMDFRVSNCSMQSIGNFFRAWSSRSRVRIESSTFHLPPGADGRFFRPIDADSSQLEVSRCLFEGAKAAAHGCFSCR